MNKERNINIANSIKETKERHSHMDVKTYEVKVVTSKLSHAQEDDVNAVFREAKWLRNSHIADFEHADRNAKTANVKVKDNIEIRPLKHLGSQIKQDIYDNIKSNIRSLSTNKKKGKNIGKLKFKSVCNCIPLRQHGITFTIYTEKNRIKIQNIKKPFYVHGLKQIPEDADITNAKFVRKPDGLYFYITCYVPKKEYVKTSKIVGIDFGIENNLNFSDEREPFNCYIGETEYMKRLSRKINREWIRNGRRHSNNNKRRKDKLKVAYKKMSNKRKDAANKIVHTLLNEYDFIAIQDEMIHNWQGGLFGKQVQNSCMGTIKAKLRNSSKVFMIERSFPSTQICPVCGSLNKHPLDKREYDCPYCGFHHFSRDKKSAQSILDEALKQVSMDRRTKSPVGAEASIAIDFIYRSKFPPMTQEAQVL